MQIFHSLYLRGRFCVRVFVFFLLCCGIVYNVVISTENFSCSWNVRGLLAIGVFIDFCLVINETADGRMNKKNLAYEQDYKKMPKNISCPHFPLCSGCTLTMNVETPPIFDEAKAFFGERKISKVSFYSDKVIGWRYRAKLAIRGTKKRPEIGLFKGGTHEVVPIPFCKVHHPKINRAVTLLRQWIIESELSPYEEKDFTGVLRYAQFVVERSSGKVQLTLVVNQTFSGDLVHWRALLAPLWNNYRDFFHSIWLNFNTSHQNVIFSDAWHIVYGEEELWENFDGVRVCFLPSSFAQANLDLFEQMLRSIQQKVSINAYIAEFYAGVGVIGLFLANEQRKIVCCEIEGSGLHCFEKSRHFLSEAVQKRISFKVGSANDLLDMLNEADTVIVDPPRKGLDTRLLESLKKTQTVKKIVYVSCGWPSFKRDCDTLLKAGWELKEVEGYLLFPGSNHIEIVAVFDRCSLYE
jgi:23S rRNA (uracil-5-)-methyltransferase RumA